MKLLIVFTFLVSTVFAQGETIELYSAYLHQNQQEYEKSSARVCKLVNGKTIIDCKLVKVIPAFTFNGRKCLYDSEKLEITKTNIYIEKSTLGGHYAKNAPYRTYKDAKWSYGTPGWFKSIEDLYQSFDAKKPALTYDAKPIEYLNKIKKKYSCAGVDITYSDKYVAPKL